MYAVICNDKIKGTFSKRDRAEAYALKKAAKHGTNGVKLWAVEEFEIALGKFEPAKTKAKEE